MGGGGWLKAESQKIQVVSVFSYFVLSGLWCQVTECVYSECVYSVCVCTLSGQQQSF